MMRCGLLGEKLGHSYSPAIHAQLADYAYGLYEVAPEDLPRIFEKGYTGCNGRTDMRASGIGLYLCRRNEPVPLLRRLRQPAFLHILPLRLR